MADDGTSKTQRVVPGPGAYEPKGSRYQNSPNWGIGSSKRADLCNSASKSVPGPNVYNLDSKVGEGPKFSMSLKTGDGATTVNKMTPGPGAYSPVKVTDVSNAYSMGSKTKFGLTLAVQPETGEHTKIAQATDFTPGPGAYEAKAVYKNVNTGPKFG